MDSEIYALVVKYGFRNLHRRIEELMLNEFEYLKEHFLSRLTPQPQVKEILNLPVAEVPQNTLTVVKAKKVQKVAKVVVPQPEPEVQETKEVVIETVIPELSLTGFRDPKEMKIYQKEQEEKKRSENEALGLDPSKILTRENLKQWIELEGRTYAWVAREKAGCPDTQVSATAQMLGIKSKISKKRGIMMSR
jgi:hypothetical protein